MRKFIYLGVLLILTSQANAQKAEIYTDSGKAIMGFDPVAYFTKAVPVRGYDSISLRWQNAEWLFSSRENLEMFRSNPEKYAPQFGGYCAFGMSNGYKAKTDPAAWSIVNGRLFLNYNKNVQTKWTQEKESRIPKADSLWPGIRFK